MVSSSDQFSPFQTFMCAGQHVHNRIVFAEKKGLFLKDGQTSHLKLIQYSPSSPRASSAACMTPEIQDASSNDLTLTESMTSAEEHRLQSVHDVQSFFAGKKKGWIVIYAGQEHSYACMNMTRGVFKQLSDSIGIFPALQDTILYIGQRRCEVEIAPPAPRVHLSTKQSDSKILLNLGIAYGLRFIEQNRRPKTDPWSLRQCVVYSKVNQERDTVQWLFVSAPALLKRQINSYMEQFVGGSIYSLFELHVLVLTTLLPMWRPYFVQVQIMLEEYKLEILEAKPDGQGVSEIDGEMSLELKNIEDDLQDAMLAIKATQNTIKMLQKIYLEICRLEAEASTTLPQHRFDYVALAFAERLNETDLLVDQVTTLINKTQNSTQIVSTFLNLENGHVLRELTSKTREEGQELKNLSEIATRDAKAVKALSLITVIFLPVTVVFNFFSASIVDNSTGTLHLVNNWWISLAVGIPLTILTLVAWSLWILKIRRDADKDKFAWPGLRLCLPACRPYAERDVEKHAAPSSNSTFAPV